MLTAALFYGQISYLTHQRVGILHTRLRTDSKSDTLLLRQERVGLSLAENEVKLHSVLLFSLSCHMNKVMLRQAFYKDPGKHRGGSVMFIVIMKELLAGNSSSMKAYLQPAVYMWIP